MGVQFDVEISLFGGVELDVCDLLFAVLGVADADCELLGCAVSAEHLHGFAGSHRAFEQSIMLLKMSAGDGQGRRNSGAVNHHRMVCCVGVGDKSSLLGPICAFSGNDQRWSSELFCSLAESPRVLGDVACDQYFFAGTD
ncbi:hypothetical protein D3C81_1575140 [compost metagenome]